MSGETASGTSRMAGKSGVVFAILVLAVTGILLAPAILNGAPFIFFDSDQYVRVGQRIFETIFGAGDNAAAPVQTLAIPLSPDNDAGGELAAVAGGRSPAYSAGLYLFGTFLGLWVVALFQAVVCAMLIVRFCQLAWGRLDWKPVLAIAAMLSLLSGLGFHAAFMMPDVFTGCLVLTLAIFLYFRPAGRLENALLVGGAFVMATFHATNLLLMVSALVAAVIVPVARPRPPRAAIPRLGIVAGIAVAVLAFNAIYATTVRAMAGEDVRSPPYLTARVLADGAGETYLAKHCIGPREPFAACTYKRIHFTDSDAFLWDPAANGFQKADPDLRALLSTEDLRFVVAVSAADPATQFLASMRNFLRQLTTARIDEIKFGTALLAVTPGWEKSSIMRLAPDAAACESPEGCRPPAFGPAWSEIVGTTNMLLLPFFLAAALAMAVQRRTPLASLPDRTANLARVAWFVALLVVANAAICGVLSGVNGRYQTRIIWTLALSMMTLAPLLLSSLQRSFSRSVLPPAGQAGNP